MTDQSPTWDQVRDLLNTATFGTARGALRWHDTTDEVDGPPRGTCRFVFMREDRIRVEDEEGLLHVQDDEWAYIRDGAGRMVRYRAAEAPANVQDGHPWTLLGNRLERGERLTDPSDYFAAAGPPQPVVVAGRAGWRVELTPPARKSYPLLLVVDAAGGALLRAGGGRGGDEWVVEMTRFETDVPVDEATFRWTGPYTDAATVSEERAARRRRATPRDEEERARVRERLES